MNRLLLVLALAASFSAHAIVTRHDLDDAKYRIAATEFPALVDMPGEGHGVLIAPQWVVTAAHTVTHQAHSCVTIAGIDRHVERVIIHPGYKMLPQALITKVLKEGETKEVTELLSSSDDIALIKLAAPVTDVKPAEIYRGDGERGMLVRIIGKGASGTGISGLDPHAPHRQALRQAYNRISSADARWIGYEFDQGPGALPLEGMSGSGDSGGPVLVEDKGEWRVAGLTAWKLVEGDARKYKPGLYGQTSYNLRLSRYVLWIDGVLQKE